MHRTEHHNPPPDRQGAGRRRGLALVLAVTAGAVLAPAVPVEAASRTISPIAPHSASRTYADPRQPSLTSLTLGERPATSATGRLPRRPAPSPTSIPTPAQTPTPTPPDPSAPHPPVGLYVASSPELAPQFCASTTTPTSRTARPVFGVSSGAPAYNTDRPNLRAAFEVSRSSGETVLTQTAAFVGSGARFQAPDGVLTDGTYRVRARTEDGSAVSPWLPWCAFTVDTSGAGPAPGVPDSLRVSTGPYSGYQQCHSVAGAPVARTGDMLSLAATPASSSTGATYPNLSATFEIGHPGQEPLIRKTEPVWPSGRVFSTGVAPGTLVPGSYQFRVRAEDGSLVSAWSPWCAFTVTE